MKATPAYISTMTYHNKRNDGEALPTQWDCLIVLTAQTTAGTKAPSAAIPPFSEMTSAIRAVP
jgi:hypothetical protein